MDLHHLDGRLVERLLQFASRKFGRDWFGELLDLLEVDELNDDKMAQLIAPCAVYEWLSEDGTLVELFLESSPRGLSEKEHGWLDAQRRSWLSVWEVQRATPGLDVEVRDLLTGEERRVLERSGSSVLSPRDGVLARVVDFGGLSVFCGMHPRLLPPRPAAAVVSGVRDAAGLRAKRVSPAELRAKVPLEGWILSWELVVERHDASMAKPPKLANTDGDPLLLTKDRFEFAPDDRSRIEMELAELAEVDEDDLPAGAERAYTFHRPGNPMHKSWDNTIVGRAVVRDAELVLETNSIRRANDLRAKVEAALEPLARHRLREHEDPEVLLRERHSRDRKNAPKPSSAQAPAPEVLDALREFKQRHLEAWVDTPIPALAGLTPRQAAVKPRKRKEVELLLKEIENQEGRAPLDQRIDVSTLWRELGLEAVRRE
jgi:hypothetical protein